MLYSFEGDVRSGKTLLATILASKDSRPIYSNYKLRLQNYHDLKPEMLVNLRESSLVIVDEVYAWIESRTSGKDINLYMGYILFQSGKRGLDIIITAQLRSTFDVRYRSMINYMVDCQKMENVGFYYSIYQTSRYGQSKPARIFLPWKNAEKYFPIYDTLELINPIDDSLIDSVTLDKTGIMKEVDRIRDILLKKAPAKLWKKGMVLDYALRNDIPKERVDLIFNAIKASELEELAEEAKPLDKFSFKHK